MSLSNALMGLLLLAACLPLAVHAQDHDDSAQEEDTGQIQQRFSELDANGDGVISFDEFSAMPMAGFNRLNATGDGIVSREEIRERRFRQIDANNDGLVSAGEFAASQRASAQLQRRQQGQAPGMRRGQGDMQDLSAEQRERIRERMQQMTPEQRQQLREQMRRSGQRPMGRPQGNQSPQ
jgi:hypothetical protein